MYIYSAEGMLEPALPPELFLEELKKLQLCTLHDVTLDEIDSAPSEELNQSKHWKVNIDKYN